MSESDEQAGFGTLHPELLAQLQTSQLGERLTEDMRRVAEAYALTMLQGQILEFAAKLAEPALYGPTDDDKSSREHVERMRKKSLNDAIEALETASPPRTGIDRIVAGLHEARRRRNALAHDFWWSALPTLITSGTDELLDELERDEQLFESMTQAMFEVALGAGVARRGLDLNDFRNTVSFLAGVLLFCPHAVKGLHLIDDGDEILYRLQQCLAALDSE